MARFSPYRSFEPPRPVTNVAEFINKWEAPGYTKNFAVKVFALQWLVFCWRAISVALIFPAPFVATVWSTNFLALCPNGQRGVRFRLMRKALIDNQDLVADHCIRNVWSCEALRVSV